MLKFIFRSICLGYQHGVYCKKVYLRRTNHHGCFYEKSVPIFGQTDSRDTKSYKEATALHRVICRPYVVAANNQQRRFCGPLSLLAAPSEFYAATYGKVIILTLAVLNIAEWYLLEALKIKAIIAQEGFLEYCVISY